MDHPYLSLDLNKKEQMPLLTGKTVVVPWDFSKHSHDALDKALDLVSDPSQIRLIHASQIVVYNEAYMVAVPYHEIDEAQHARDSFKKFQEDNPKYASLDFEVKLGDPSTIVCEYANEQDAELIVISSHGYSGLAHIFLGSVAEKVVRHAHCPVLVLRK